VRETQAPERGRLLDRLAEAKGELAKAFIVLKPDMSATEQEMLSFCRARLAAYKVPRQAAFVSDLPRNSSGKILRRILREGATDGQNFEGSFAQD
jgi:acyl-coenzyme A synthetase/AMP-(fatty) acid ligase